MTDPAFPPLMQGLALPGDQDPFTRAAALAAGGCDGGTVLYTIQADRLGAAIVFAPEVALDQAMAMLPLCAVGFQNALGALAPPEVAVHLGWEGGIYLNGGRCGGLRATAGPAQSGVSDWLVIGLDLSLLQITEAPGDMPDVTSLYDEGCAGIDPVLLLEAWARHVMNWISRWEAEGNAALYAEWRGLVRGMDEPVASGSHSGIFLGVDERFGMLIRDGAATHLLPLTSLLEEPG